MATRNLSEFTLDLENFGEQVREDASKLVRRIAFAVDRAVVMSTPVGNPDLWRVNNHPTKKRRGEKGYVGKDYVGGRARANWIPTLNVPYQGTVEKIDKQGSATIALLAPITAKFRLGDTLWISNNLPYIVPLNNGHSTQAPAGFVELAIQAGIVEGTKP